MAHTFSSLVTAPHPTTQAFSTPGCRTYGIWSLAYHVDQKKKPQWCHSFVTFQMGRGSVRPPRSCVRRLHMLGHTMRVQNQFLANQAFLRSTASNMFSATLHTEPVAEYLANELKLNRMCWDLSTMMSKNSNRSM